MKLAAEELCVTPSAVSQLMRSLEADLGTSLFRRDHRALALTDSGHALLPPVRNAFRLIAEASDKVRRDPGGGVLTVSVATFFAESWLIPRLGEFYALSPEIDLRIVATTALANLVTGEADVAIRHGLGAYRGMSSELLMAPPVAPVAAPLLVDRLGLPASAAALAAWPKIHDADRGAWAAWFASQAVPDPGSTRGPSFDDPGLLRAAVLAGQGAGLLPTPLIAPYIADGRLIAIGPEAQIDELGYYVVAPKASLGRPSIAVFHAWVKRAAKLSPAL